METYQQDNQKHDTQNSESSQKPKPPMTWQDRVLWPGDVICRLFDVKGLEERFFLRLYVNIFIYTKLSVGLAVFLAVYF